MFSLLLSPKETLFMPCLADDKPKKECCEVAKLLPRPIGSVGKVGLALNSGAGSHDTTSTSPEPKLN
jgi:hypothetical protein